ncbi:glycosyltransferase family 2 protein [Glycomyces sp. MUSA5-2]|uniref:glycosyltransferase family 2 protein n=1 Tax=Glycomyces sp. MUSA5-2 TaxID=2053002 RepID=UPI00300B27DF
MTGPDREASPGDGRSRQAVAARGPGPLLPPRLAAGPAAHTAAPASVTAVVLAWDAADAAATVERLGAAADERVRLRVRVIDARGDGVVAAWAAAHAPHVQVMRPRGPVTWVGAANLACTVARSRDRADWVLLAGTEASPAPGALGDLVAAGRRRPHAAALLLSDPEPPDPPPAAAPGGRCVAPVPVWGSWLVRSAALDRLGLLDTRFGPAALVEWCRRAHHHGWSQTAPPPRAAATDPGAASATLLRRHRLLLLATDPTRSTADLPLIAARMLARDRAEGVCDAPQTAAIRLVAADLAWLAARLRLIRRARRTPPHPTLHLTLGDTL